MFKLIIVLSASLMLSGCAIGKGVRPTYVQNGQQVYEAKCNGLARTMSDCYEQASEQCKGSFKALSHDGTQAYMNTAFGSDKPTYTPIVSRSLAFTCE